MSDLADYIEPVALQLRGKPNPEHSNRNEWRYGKNGSLVVKVAGPNKGTFVDHEAGKGGGVLDLIAHEKGGDRKAAMDWFRRVIQRSVDHPRPAKESRAVATYSYLLEDGALNFQVVRYEPKIFRQRRPDGAGGWIWDLDGVRPVPYRLPELIEAISLGQTVFIVEGEKDVDRLRRDNIPATCNSAGAGKWRDEFAPLFAGVDVVLVPDNDDTGRKHMEQVARSLAPLAARVRVLTLPALPRKGDVSDWYEAGGTVDELHALADAAPDWRPSAPTRLKVVWLGEEDAGPPLSWLVKGLLVDGGLSVIYGQPGTSKTFLALDLARSVAEGRDWFGRRVQHGLVVYVSGEGGTGMRQRMKVWTQEKGGDARAPFALIPESVNLFDDDAGAEILIEDVRACSLARGVPVRLIVLDTLSRMIGSGDEDKARDINLVVQRAEKIQRETGAHVLIVHHSGKDRDRGMRGSNALHGAGDAVFEIFKHESGLCEFKVVKVKDGGDVEPFRYSLRQSVLGQDEDGEDITSCVVEPSDASPGDRKAGPRLSNSEKIALDALDTALLDFGQQQPTTAVPTGCLAVRVNQWRDTSYRRGISGADTPKAKEMAFRRARESLQAKRVIGADGDWIWRAG